MIAPVQHGDVLLLLMGAHVFVRDTVIQHSWVLLETKRQGMVDVVVASGCFQVTPGRMDHRIEVYRLEKNLKIVL